MIFRSLLLIVIFYSCVYAQSISAKDVLFLIDLGLEEEDIIKHIKESSEEKPFSRKDLEFLKEKGVSASIIEALQKRKKLSAANILNLLKNNISVGEIISQIRNENKLADYAVKDWLFLHRHNVPKEIILALQKKINAKNTQINLHHIKKWHSGGMDSEALLAKLQNADIDMESVNTLSLLKMKDAGFPKKIIKYLAEKHLNPENKDILEIIEDTKKENIKKKKKLNTTHKLVSPKNPAVYVKLYPNAKHLNVISLGDEESLAIVKRAFHCSLFSSSADMIKIELFYKKHYKNIQRSRIEFNGVVQILKLKFPLPGFSKLMEVRYYLINTKKLSYIKNLEKIKKRIAKNNYSVKRLIEEIDTQNYLHEIGNISQEQKNKKLKLLQSKLNLIANASLYWDYKAIENVLKHKKNILLILQPNASHTGKQKFLSTIDKISTIGLQPEKVQTLAKDFPTVVFPSSQMVIHHKIDEGLRRTSKQRSIYRTLFLCDSSSDEIEKYYRKYHKNASIWRIQYLDSFQIIKAKFEIPEIRSKAEIAFYVLTISPKSTRWESKRKRVKERLKHLERAVKNIDHEIKQLQNLLIRKKIGKNVAELRINKLKKEKYLKLNTSSYWDFTVMDRVMASQRSVLLVTETKRHY